MSPFGRLLGTASVLAVSLATLSAAAPTRTYACSGPYCIEGAATPTDGAVVPANAVSVMFSAPLLPDGAVATYGLARVDGAGRTALASTVEEVAPGLHILRPDEPVPEGTELEASYEGSCRANEPVQRFRFRVGPSAPRPTRLGTLHAAVTHGAITLPGSPGCNYQLNASSARVELTLDAEALPYEALFRYQLRADGEESGLSYLMPSFPSWSAPAVGGSLLGRGVDRVDVLCDAEREPYERALSEGMHVVQMVAVLPDGSELRSNELTVDLRCAVERDAGEAELDAATDANEADPASAPGADTRGERDGKRASSGCTLTPLGAADALPPWAVALCLCVGGAWLGRRRTRSAA